MPGSSPKHPHKPHGIAKGRTIAFRGMAVCRLAGMGHAGALCLGLFATPGACAESAGPLPAPSVSQATTVTHLTDAQDRLMTGQLSPDAETQSHANALYAEAMGAGSETNPQEALSQLRQVAALDPHFADAQVKIANMLLQSGQTDSALEQLKTAAAANPESVAVEAALGYAQRLEGQNDEAVRLCSDVLAKDAGQAIAMRVLLEIAADKDDLANGIVQVENILKTASPPVPASTWLTLGRLYVEVARGGTHTPTGDTILKTLLPIQQQAAAKSPPDVETLTLLADTYRDLGQKHDALKTLKQAGTMEPSNVDIILRCADLETDLGQKTDALDDYEKVYRLNPNLIGLREMLGRLYLDNAKFENAARLLEEALADSPNDPGIEIDLGVAYEETRQHEKAGTFFQQAFAADSCPPEAYLKLVVFQLSTHRIEQAGETLAAAQKRFPQSAKIQFYKAIQRRYAKNYDGALASLKQVRDLASGPETSVFDISYYLESALIMNLAGKKALIEPTLREGLARYPDNPDLMNELAYFWADQGNHLAEALTLSRRATEIDPDNGPIEDTCGWVYFRLGKAKEALPYLQRAALMTNNDPVVLQHMGDAYLRLGREREAIDAWRSALKKAPDNHDLTNRIDAALAQANNAHLRYAPTK